MYQLSIPGTDVNRYPQTMRECEDVFADLCILFTKAVVPEEFIKEAFQTVPLRTKAKRLREKVISDGYRLMLHVREALDSPKTFHNFMWREDLIIKQNHFELSIERMYEFIDEHAIKYERA